MSSVRMPTLSSSHAARLLSDTPPGLKPGGFSELPPSYRPRGLACVLASTHDPQVVRDTILHGFGSGDLPRLAMLEHREDVDLSHHVAMRLKPASRAAIPPPLRFVALLTLRAALARVVLVLQLDRDSFGFGLIRDVL